ncbi:hypothetical protein GUJ93_ZPchr0005g15145 [Zizania palustris]|uniref:Uncharacterized protein n=1 Tax=Zizania palustris TaxID=103762 RepID=A0A8J5VZZ5_ZIZPA|nr:hypothetical protein GUJ93_ZPchr0005g15145 [Zizania palustris]
MAAAMTEPRIGRVDGDEEEEDDDSDVDRGVELSEEVRRRVSRLSVSVDGEGGPAGEAVGRARGRERGGGGGGSAATAGGGGGSVRALLLPPPDAWLAVENVTRKSRGTDPEADEWMRALRGGCGGGGGPATAPQRRSSFSMVRRERAAREAWLDRAWEMKKIWHERNGGAPDADTPVVVVVGKGSPSSPSSHAAGSGGGGGVAMDMEEVRACRDLGLELPSDCTVEIQCYGLSATSSPTHAADICSVSSSAAEDPTDVKARLKVWAQAVALASTTHLGS